LAATYCASAADREGIEGLPVIVTIEVIACPLYRKIVR
jgi:hypothetical protein